MPGRTFTSESYRFGFNGMEKDDEVKGAGNSLDFGARIYDSRLGRWLSIDPLMAKYPDMSPYNFAGNSPILFLDPDGMVIVNANSPDAKQFKAILEKTEQGKIVLQLMEESPNKIYIHVYSKKETERWGSDASNVGMATGYQIMGAVLNEKAYNQVINGEFPSGEEIRDHTEWDKERGMFIQIEESEEIHIIVFEGAVTDGSMEDKIDEKAATLLYVEEGVQSTQDYLDYGPKARSKNSNGNYEFNENWQEEMSDEEEIYEYYENDMSNEKEAKDIAKKAASEL